MTTTSLLSDDVKLHEREVLTLRAVVKNAALMITRAIRNAPDPVHAKATTPSRFTDKWGCPMCSYTPCQFSFISGTIKA